MTSQSNPFSTLVHAALLGTDHPTGSTRATVDGDVAALVARIPRRDAAGALLTEAALLGLRTQAGRMPMTARGVLVAPAPAESSEQAVVHAGLVALLNTMLTGANVEVLPEWLSEVGARGLRASSMSLPALLDIGQQRAELRPLVRGVLGARGRWLASQRKEWAYAIEQPIDPASVQAAWELSSSSDRSILLEQVRERDAAFGRSLVESTWREESAAGRVALVAGLRTNLSPDDEPFLESALDDRRLEVRHEAAELLALLPSSALVARMTERATAMLAYEPRKLLRGAKLTAEPPAERDAAMARDGVVKGASPSRGLGERAWLLLQIVGVVPPRQWSETWSAKPAALIALAIEGEWSVALLSAWAQAAVRNRDAEWADALLRAGVAGDGTHVHASHTANLLAVLDVERREAFVGEVAGSAPATPAALELLANSRHNWSTPFARVVLGWLRERIAVSASDSTTLNWRLAEMLPAVALHMPHALASEAEEACRTDVELTGALPRAVERFVALIAFRHALHQELHR